MDEKAKQSFGRRLSKAMKAAGLDAPALARKMNKTKPAVYKWMEGEAVPGIDNVISMCKELKIHIQWLATGDGPMNATETLSQAEIELLTVFRDMPPIAQESAANMLKLGRSMYLSGDEARRQKVQESMTVHEKQGQYKVTD